MAELDFGALDWVRGEIEENLKNARQALEAYVETPDDSTRIRHCLHQLHQVNSVLGMMQLTGVAVLSAEMRDLAQALMNGEVSDVERAHEALMQGMLHLPLVLERVQREERDDSALVIGLANDLREVRGQPPLAGAAASDIDLTPLAAPGDPDARSRFERRGGVMVTRKARTAYQRGLVGCVRDAEGMGPRTAMLRVCNGLVKLCDETPVGRFCVVLAAYVEALCDESERLNAEDLGALRQVDSLLKRLVRNGASGLTQLPPTQLSRRLAERVAHSGSNGPARRAAFALLQLEGAGTAAGVGMPDDREARRAVAVNLRDEVASVKDRLDLYVRSEIKNPEDLEALVPALKQMSGTMAVLGAESLRGLIDEQVPVIDALSAQDEVSEAALLEVAAALMAVDGGLEAMITTGADDAASAQVQEVHRVVLGEVRRGLQDVKDAVTEFEASRWEHERLKEVPGLLENVRGGLVMIPLERAAAVIARCQAYIGHLTGSNVVPEWQVFDRFTEAISGIEYFVERLMETSGRQDQRVLEYAEESAQSLLAAGDDEALTVFDEHPDTDPVPGDAYADNAANADTETDAVAVAGNGLHDAPVEALAGLSEHQPPGDADPAAEDESGRLTLADGAVEVDSLGSDLLGPDPLAGLLGDGEAGDEPLSLLDGMGDATDAAPSGYGAQDDAATAPAPDPEPQAPAPAAADAEPAVDPEILEVFVEEMDEVLETLHACLPRWMADAADEEAINEIRRSFHTLKGSGRMVGADAIGELGWSIENMLNRVLEKTVAPSPDMFGLIADVLRVLPGMRESFAHGRDADPGFALLAEQADVLASGGELAELEPADEEHDEAFDPALLAAMDAEDRALAGGAVGDDIETIFAAEAAVHLQTLAGFADQLRAAGDVEVPSAAYRAAHTLCGSAAMAGMDRVLRIAQPLEATLERWRQDAVSLPDDLQLALLGVIEVLERTVAGTASDDEMASSLAALAAADAPADGVEVVAGPRVLLDLDDIELVVDADLLLRQWDDGEPDMLQLARLEDVTRSLALGADRFNLDELAALCRGLAEHHAGGSPDISLLREGHAALVGALDALAIDQSPGVDAQLLGRFGQGDLLVAAPVAEPPAEPVVEAGVPVDMPDLSELPEVPDPLDVPDMLDMPDVADVSELPDLSDSDAGLADDVPAFELDAPVGGVEPLDEVDDGVQLELGSDLDLSAGELAEEADTVGPGREAGADETPSGALSIDEVMDNLSDEQLTHAADQAEVEATVVSADTDDSAGVIAELGAMPADADMDIVEVFFEEAAEICESIDQSAHDWRAAPDNAVHLETLLRALHTLKGGARMTGMAPLGDATHAIESELVAYQESGDLPGADFLAELQVRVDRLVGAVAHAQALARGGVPASVAEAPAESEVEAQPADAGRVAAEPEVAEPAADAVAHRAPPQEMIRVSSGVLESLVNLAGEASITRARIEQEISDFGGSLEELESTIERVREQLRRLEIEMEAQVLFREERTERRGNEDFDPLEMDRYSQLQALTRALSESASDLLDLKETLTNKSRDAETLLLQQARTNTELQEGLMRTRMVPFARLVPRLRRIVRQIGRELRKEVDFEASEAEGELDRNVLERMIAPLEHMLRNAVDHGVENPEVRESAGKPRAGRIELSLSREGGDVVLALKDDGGGVDVEAVRSRALERGLMAPDVRLTDEEIMQFVLAPGFSTAAEVTQISGRGVGMDVVHSEVKQLGGSVSIASVQGRGTTITVRLPFTVSVNRALMVNVGDDLYAIPLNMIEGIVRVAPQELARLYEVPDTPFDYASERYQLRYLGAYVARAHHVRTDVLSLPVILVRSGDQAMALHVDAVQGSREIVVKSLGPQFAGVGGISGATILGDGSVVVILDLLALIRNYTPSEVALEPEVPADLPTCVLVVDDSVTVRKVTSRLLERRGFEVLLAKDGVEAVSQLQERRPDIMLLDIEMPRMDGFEVARQVREDSRLESLPIVMISSRSGVKHQERARELGVDRFLGKPFQEKELLEIIDELVEV